MNQIILVRGLPGSGKTSLIESIRGESPVFAADDHFYELGNGKYNFDPSELHTAHLNCQKKAESEMYNGTKTIFVTNTFTTNKEMKPYQEMAERYGYRCSVIIVENRHGNSNVHNVPNETIERMKNRFNIQL